MNTDEPEGMSFEDCVFCYDVIIFIICHDLAQLLKEAAYCS